jgi:hypothetical protein
MMNRTHLKANVFSDLGPEVRAAALEGIRAVLTENNTDALIEIIMGKLRLPLWLRWLPLRAVLDRLLPDALLRVFEEALS